jgi:tight adherence protein B
MNIGAATEMIALLLLTIMIATLIGLILLRQAEARKARERMVTVAQHGLAAAIDAAEAQAAKSPVAATTAPAPEEVAILSRNLLQAAGARNADRSLKGQIAEQLAAGGFHRPLRFYAMVTGGAGLLLGLVLWNFLSIGLLSFLVGQVIAVFAFRALIQRAIKQRLIIIEREFPAAIDIIVRGVRSGMPLNEGLRLVFSEAHPMIAKEFGLMLDELALGIPMSECVRRMAQRMPIPDIQFFVVVLGLQASTGGSVANALEASAETLRSRRALREKIIVMSNEARFSAYIIGALPILVAFAMAFTSPDYIALLFTTGLGNAALAATVIWMSLGIFVMRAMINFEV